MPRSEDQLADRLPPRSRWRGLGGSPSTRTKARNGAEPWRQSAGGNRGVLVEGVCALAGVFPRPDTIPPWNSWSEPASSIGRSTTSGRSATPTAPTTAGATSTTGRTRHRTAWCPRTSPPTILINSRVAGTTLDPVIASSCDEEAGGLRAHPVDPVARPSVGDRYGHGAMPRLPGSRAAGPLSLHCRPGRDGHAVPLGVRPPHRATVAIDAAAADRPTPRTTSSRSLIGI
jgi:hypothetical protein